MKNYKKAIKRLAQRHDVAASEVKRDMTYAINSAWNNPDPAVQEFQRKLFPNGKPSIDEFLLVLTQVKM